jgi:hypothetical protein
MMRNIGLASLLVGVAVTGALAATGCKRESSEEQGAAPPPAPSAKPGACASGGGEPNDPLSAAFFPRSLGDYCVDPHGDVRSYGQEAKSTIDDVCIQQLDGECETYKSYGLRRAVTLRYVDGKGSPGTVAVLLTRYGSKEGAYGFFTKRIVADSDPAQVTLTSLKAGAGGALGSGIAYVYKGDYLLELSYTNEAESPDQMRASGKRILPDLATAIGDKLPGDTTLPPAVQALPAEHLLPMGVTYAPTDVLGISGVGPGALGYYKDGDKRYRVVSLGRADEDSADDVLATLKKVDRASKVKELFFPALAFGNQSSDAAPRTEWLIGRKGNRLFGVGDEELVLGRGSKEEDEKAKLTRDEKIALLKHLVQGT